MVQKIKPINLCIVEIFTVLKVSVCQIGLQQLVDKN